MDTELQPTPPQENGSKIQESIAESNKETASANGKDDSVSSTPKTNRPRSRSRTPQKKKDKRNNEEVVKSSLTKIEESVNGHEEKKTKALERKSNKEVNKSAEEDTSKSEEKKVRTSERIKEANKSVEEVQDTSKNGDNTTKDDKNVKKSTRKPTKTPEQHIPDKQIIEQEMNDKSNDIEMEPLILTSDEPSDPELQFDEYSDRESGKGSPVIQSRCKTRRSLTRNIPTPKTPKAVTDSESEKNSVAPTPTPENLAEDNDSLDISTKVEVGGDTTRLDLLGNISLLSGDRSYLNEIRERSLRHLSPRKTIRPLHDSYRQTAFRNIHQNKSDLNLTQDTLDRGLKRKRSITPEEKLFKSESGFSSYLTMPLNSFKRRFWSSNDDDDDTSSMPKLTGYKDDNKDIHEMALMVREEPKEKSPCAIM